MFQFIETMAIVNGHIRNFNYHNERFITTYNHHFGTERSTLLADTILKLSSNIPPKGLHKLRILYSKNIDNISIEPYKISAIKKIKLIEDNSIDYTFKSSNRDYLNKLFSQRGESDNIIIIKNNFITDTAFGNTIFFNGDQWVTPSTPLLKGTMRKYLLDNNIIFEAPINKRDLSSFKSFKHINAMISFEESPTVDISAIV